ncbi:MAG: hypothetical protein V8T87_06910 [Victivallales bacterium]
MWKVITRIKPSKYKSGNYPVWPHAPAEKVTGSIMLGTFTVKEKDPSPYEYRVVLAHNVPE